MLLTIESEARWLVGQVSAPPRQVLDDPIGEIEELQRDLVYVEAFVVEGHRERERDRERADALGRSAARERLQT